MEFLANKRSCILKVLVPISVLSTEHRKDLKTLTVAYILRALSIFRASHLVLYKDPHASDADKRLFLKVARYLMTPPYLRKMIVPIDPDLKYVGLAPPLTLPLHTLSKRLTLPQIRWGLIIERLDDELAKAYVGVSKLCILKSSRNSGEMILVRVERDCGSYYKCSEVDPDAVTVYLGPKIVTSSSLSRAITSHCTSSLLIEFTKLGKPATNLLNNVERLEDLKRICCVFGSPYLDPSEITRRELNSDIPALSRAIQAKHVAVDAVVNQGVKSVRTTEALYVALSVLNLALLRSSRCS